MELAVLRLCEVEEMQSFDGQKFLIEELAVHFGDSSVSKHYRMQAHNFCSSDESEKTAV